MQDLSSQPIGTVLEALRTDGMGLTQRAAERRRATHGSNVLPEGKRPGMIAIILDELRNPLLVILSIAAIAAILIGERVDGAFILVTLAITAGFGISMAFRAERALDALKRLLHPTAIVVRDGRALSLPSIELVPGDRVMITRGARIPADARVLEAHALEVDESMLTGESVPVQKSSMTGDAVQSSRRTTNRALREFLAQGTLVVEGQGVAVIVATGTRTKLASIAASLASEREQTPLQAQLRRLTKTIAIAVTAIAVMLFGLGVATGQGAGTMLTTAIAVAVAAVPEGLAVAVTAILAVGTVRLAKRRCLVRRIIAAETLGSVSVILTDKTGTLTEGHMRAVEVMTLDTRCTIVPGAACAHDVRRILDAAALGTEVIIANPEESPSRWTFIGSGTEAALVAAAGTLGVDVRAVRESLECVDRLPFSAERKYSATLHGRGDNRELVLVGATERIVSHGAIPKLLAAELEAKGREGYRIVGVATASIRPGVELIAELSDPTANASLLGIFLIRDPIRPGAAAAISAAQAAGIRTVMVTGDHPATAKRIAEDLGLAAGEPRVTTGDDLNRMDDKALAEHIEDVDVFARTTHAQKVRLVEAWRSRGSAIAVTGDGVNDAPALIAADVGVAMGSGTDISREAADLVLLDDRYETIVAGIEGGRTMWDNIWKTANYLLISSFTEVLIVGVSVVSGLPLLVLPAQILWVNLLEDTLPAAALAFEPSERGIMKEPPRSRSAPFFNKEMRWLVFGVGLIKDVLLIATGFILLNLTHDLALTRTIVFGALATDSLFFIFAIRSLRVPVWRSRPWRNPWVLAAVGIAGVLLAVGLVHPAMQPLLQTVPIPLWGWGVIIGLSLMSLVLVEAVKDVFRYRSLRTHTTA